MWVAADSSEQVEPTETGHIQIDDGKIRAEAIAQGIERRLSVGDLGELGGEFGGDDVLERGAFESVIVGDKDFEHGGD